MIKIYDTKLQKTKPSEGYHLLHCENTSKANSDRILAFILYLNTVEEGQTYFPEQDIKIKHAIARYNNNLWWSKIQK